ncbi:MAG: galactose mutarotase [Rhodobacteraceae bacterium]|nr:galactose mutarotase [Paracoccaceae bacterium]
MASPRIQRFGKTAQGAVVDAVNIAAGDIRATILTYGATIQSLRLGGTDWPMILGAPTLAPYEAALRYTGAIVGPVANRIAGARAVLDGRTFRFDPNEAGKTTLHGGTDGTHNQIWQIVDANDSDVQLALDLANGFGGFPGRRRIVARFLAAPPADLVLTISAESDAPTWFNLANHCYWNLDGRATTAGHRLRVPADRYLPLGPDLTPSGPPAAVAGTDFDLRQPVSLRDAPRYDHNFCLADGHRLPALAAELVGLSGHRLRIDSTLPGLQIYDGANLSSGGAPGLLGRPYSPFAGIALEPQDWPDAPNRPDFPTVTYRPGETYRQMTRFRLDRLPAA